MPHRFHIPPEKWGKLPACRPDERNQDGCATLLLDGDEARHCSQVLRHREGDEIVVFNGAGGAARCRVAKIAKHEVHLETLAIEESPPPAFRITLAPSLIKAEAWEWLLEKATELGASAIQPVMAERSVVHLNARDTWRKMEKWNRILIESCKQCGLPWLPKLLPPKPLGECVASGLSHDLKLVASLAGNTRPIKAAVASSQAKQPASACILTGPEGDFSPAELSSILAAGFTAITLGPQTLRAETAAIVSLALLAEELRCSGSTAGPAVAFGGSTAT